MRVITTDVSPPPVRPRGSIGLVPFVIAASVAALLLTAAGLAGLATPAQAALAEHTAAPSQTAATPPPSNGLSTSTSTPTPSPSTPPPTPAAPTLDPLPGSLVTAFPLSVTGEGTPGDTIDVSGGSSSSASSRCQATVAENGTWGCDIAHLPDGPGVPVRAVSHGTDAGDSGRVDVLNPPTITSPSAGVPTAGGIRGTAYPGSTVTVTAETGAACTFPVGSNGAWGCVISGLPDGRHTISARQVAPFSSERSAAGPALSIVVDTTPPPAPTITSPGTGATAEAGHPLAIAGRGEEGDHVTIYASLDTGTAVACTATVQGGAWSCQATLQKGDYTLSGLQRDAAGNVSPGSNAVALAIGLASPPATTASHTSKPAPTPRPTATSPAAPPTTAPPAEPTRPGTKGWIGTPFTIAAAPVVDAQSFPGWVRSAVLAVAALLLLVLPARLLAATLARGRGERGTRRSRPSVFGRNRSRAELSETSALLGRSSAPSAPSTAPAAAGGSVAAALIGSAATPAHADPTGERQPRWLAPLVGIVAATLVTLSTSVQDAGAYVRLLLAVGVAVLVVNAVWILAARGYAPHLGLTPPRLRVRPIALVLVAATALGSRFIGLEPALLFGLTIGVALGPHVGRVRRGRMAAVQVSAVAALGVLAWLAVGILPPASDALSAFGLEFVNSLSLLGIGSVAVALLPFGGFSGRAIAQWSRAVWLGISLVVYTLLFALLLPVASLVQTGMGAIAAGIAALLFAALSVSMWLWERFVEPAR